MNTIKKRICYLGSTALMVSWLSACVVPSHRTYYPNRRVHNHYYVVDEGPRVRRDRSYYYARPYYYRTYERVYPAVKKDRGKHKGWFKFRDKK